MCGKRGAHEHSNAPGGALTGSGPTASGPHRVEIHQALLAKNDRQADVNRSAFLTSGVVVVNLLSSPGSGKTRLLERTLADLRGQLRMGVIVGDLQTDNDARRLRGYGAPVLQITTGTLCHLEADMVHSACRQMELGKLDVLFIENVGNLVCPASFDLGEAARVVLLSTTEGEDKPLKYPVAFKWAHVVVLTKMDLAEVAGFDRQAALDHIRGVAPQARLIETSARDGRGLSSWFNYLQSLAAGDVSNPNV